MEKPVLDFIKENKDDSDETKKEACYMTSDWFANFHKIYEYKITGSADHPEEYLVEDTDIFKSIDFNGETNAVVAEMKKYPNPYGD